eukprot:scaffold56292_cov54-Phaeocystis_antarctica.AAC.1
MFCAVIKLAYHRNAVGWCGYHPTRVVTRRVDARRGDKHERHGRGSAAAAAAAGRGPADDAADGDPGHHGRGAGRAAQHGDVGPARRRRAAAP